MFRSPDCYDCKYKICLHGIHICEAFFNGIPNEIFFKGVKHDKKMFDQTNDLIFELEEKPAISDDKTI